MLLKPPLATMSNQRELIEIEVNGIPIGFSPNSVGIFLDAVLIGATALFAVSARRFIKMAKFLDKSFNIKANLKALDKNQDAKNQLNSLLIAIRAITKADYACLGILHNGKVTEWGYSFSQVTWELENFSEGLQPINAKLKDYPVNTWLIPKEGWQHIKHYNCYPIYFGTVQIGILLLSEFDRDPVDIPNPQSLTSITKDIQTLIRKNFLF